MDTSFIVLAVVVILVALLLSILMCVIMLRTARRILLRSQYRDYVFEKIDSLTLKPATAKWFERHTPALEALGFTIIDTYRLLPEPCTFDSRFFAGRRRDVFATIEDYDGRRTVCMASVLEDGTYMETAIMRALPKTVGTDGPLLFHYAPGATVAKLYEQHIDHVRHAAEERETHVMELDPEQATEVADYGHRLLHWKLYEKGLSSQPPPPREPMMVAG